jgi:hypothetical protein
MARKTGEVYYSTRFLLEELYIAVPPEGGSITCTALVRRLDRIRWTASSLPSATKIVLLRRLLELSVRAAAGRPVAAFIGVKDGRVTHPRRPRGVQPVHDEVLFEPSGLS